MGGGTALPRNVDGRVGQARLAKQTRFAATQPGRVSGCAVVTTTKIGGRDVSRLALRRSNAENTTRLYFDRHSNAGAGHRREHGDLQFDQRRVVARAPVSGSGSDYDDLGGSARRRDRQAER